MNCCRLQTHKVLIGPLSRSAARVEHLGHCCLPSCFGHAFAGRAKLIKAPQPLSALSTYGLQKWGSPLLMTTQVVMTSFHMLGTY